ncbi:MAG: acyltransferase family protein [Bacilli bacterium]
MKIKIKNSTVSLWCFILVVAIGLTNLNATIWKNSFEDIIFNGGKFLSFFLLLAGFFLMSYFKKKKDEKLEKASSNAWRYTLKTYSKLYPALLGGVSLAFIVKNVIEGTKITELFSLFMNSLWEFIGLSQVGTFGNALGNAGLWNGPLWIISAIIISSLILYYILSKNEDFFVGLFAPVLIIFTTASVTLTNSWISGIGNGLFRVMSIMSLGVLMYYVVRYFKNKKFSENLTLAFSFVHIGLALFIIYTCFKGFTWNEFSNVIVSFIFLVVLLTNKDYISALYNNSKICEFLGNISLYYYACHIVFALLLSTIFPEMGYHASIIFNVLFSFCWAFIMYYFDEFVITPIFRKDEIEEKNIEKKKPKKLNKKKIIA